MLSRRATGEFACEVRVVAAEEDVVCRDAIGECDVSELCDGAGPECPDDLLMPIGTSCGTGEPTFCIDGRCEICVDGADCVPGVPATALCAAGRLSCADGVPRCDPVPGEVAGIDRVCRPSGGACDPAEMCDGVSTECPPDAQAAEGSPCGVGVCSDMGECVECQSSLDCDDGLECSQDVCVGSSCVHPPAAAGSPCASGMNVGVCSGTSDFACVECVSDDQCATPRPACDVALRQCVECVDDSHCSDGDPCTTDACTTGTCSVVPNTLCAGPAVDLELGAGFACVLRSNGPSNGSVWCWGENGSGQLGNGSTQSSSVPVMVADFIDVRGIGVGNVHACAVHFNGQISCWGWNEFGQAGDGTRSERVDPVHVREIDDATMVTAGYGHSCALRNGEVWCWGRGIEGELGNGFSAHSITPTRVLGIDSATQISGRYGHSCALHNGGEVACWGTGAWGGLGYGLSIAYTPFAYPDLPPATDLDTSVTNTCVLTETPEAICWGQPPEETRLTPDPIPTPVSGSAGAVQISIDDRIACLRQADGTIACWGATTGFDVGSVSTPMVVASLADVSDVQTTSRNICAIHDSGRVSCWGHNAFGQVGDGTTTERLVPTPVVGFE